MSTGAFEGIERASIGDTFLVWLFEIEIQIHECALVGETGSRIHWRKKKALYKILVDFGLVKWYPDPV